jgi:hypothetical protein
MQNIKTKLTIGLLAVLGASLIQSTTQAGQRPLSDFLSRQGAYCVHQLDPATGNIGCDCVNNGYNGTGCLLQVPPAPNYVVWTDPFAGAFVSFDYAGLANKALGDTLGTTWTGSINEVLQQDGSVVDTIILHTDNALTWVSTGSFFQGTILFGHTTTQVAAGAQASLGSCTLHLVLQGPAGAPLPDLVEAECGCGAWSFVSISFEGEATGTLPSGSPARVQVTQVGLIEVNGVANPNSRVGLDAFPAEHIHIQATGK